ncbi:glycosyltransferase [Roseiconus lacunae]|uniref:Glycosyltransferase n=1 Tax=Roseiconus lacunae TaxID=2605694 RepID=A0ABT7PRN1_9BACT|nr:glycosyltransferase [Roseiconus lacunae]MDM4018934.1 glycosyltransferase [Roseiconus lacunae]
MSVSLSESRTDRQAFASESTRTSRHAKGPKVLHIMPTMNPSYGGPCQGVRNLVPPMDRLGTTSEVVSFDPPENDFSPSDPFVTHCLGSGRGPWSYNRSYRPWLEANACNYDVLIIHGDWLYQSIATIRSLAKLRKHRPAVDLPKVYAMPHGMLDPWFQRDASRRIKAIRNWIYWKVFEHRVIEESDGVLFTCHQELELARIPFRPYRPKLEIDVGYGVPRPPAADEEKRQAFLRHCPELDDRPYLLFLSRIDPKKGIDLLIRAYAAVSAEFPVDTRIPALVIAGPDDSAYAREMKRLAGELGLTKPSDHNRNHAAVQFTGMLKGDAKWGAFYGCDAFVLPSHQENFGIAVAEALACGAPVLISNQVNIFVEIQNAKAGLIFDDNFEGTCDSLRQWLSLTPAERTAYRTSATACYQRYFSVDGAAKQFFEAIAGAT